MSRTTLCAITAAGLVILSAGLMAARYRVLGNEILAPAGPGVWKVTMLVSGTSAGTNGRLLTATPLELGRQHIRRESFQSAEFSEKPPSAKHPQRREVVWSQRAAVPPGPFRVHYEFYTAVDVHRPTHTMSQLAKTLYAPPQKGEGLQGDSLVETDHKEITSLARRLTADREGAGDQVSALFHFVDKEIGKEPTVGAGPGLSAVGCLKNGGGDSRAKSRLLVALCRNRGIPARLVTGLRLMKGREGQEESAHVWVEAWVRDHWLPLCPFYHYCGHLPSTYLIFGLGDVQMAKGRNGVGDLDYGFLVEHTAPEAVKAADPNLLAVLFRQFSLDSLPPPEQRLVEFLLLLPIAALIVCIYRNGIGLQSFGTFAPALVGLAFRDFESMPGILVFLCIVLVGWLMRRVLDRYHLLQVPRTAFMLSLVVVVLISAVVAANLRELPATKYIPLFPLVILTGMIERFWTLEVEDGTSSSFKTLLGTLLISGTIALFLSWRALVDHMFRFPETLGVIMAIQLLIGRYTGYRVSELFRFRSLMIGQDLSGGGALRLMDED